MRKLIQHAFVMGWAALLLLSCGNKEEAFDGSVSLSGKLSNQPEGQVVLSRYDNDRIQAVDTLSVGDSGEFSYVLELEGPNFYELDLYGEKTVRLALFEEDVFVTYDFETDQLDVAGSKDSQLMLAIDELTAAYQEAGNELNSEFYEAMADKNQARIQEIQEQAMELELDHAEKIKGVIAESGGSFAALAGLGMLNPRTDFNYLDSVIVALGDRYPEMKLIASWKQELDELRALSIGQPAPEISLPNPKGEVVNLSDLRGKYVLIDFWAGWCKPCRDENPNVVRLYNQYKDQGFEVFGVSLDRTRDMWIRAIEEDGLEWTQVSDLKYFNSEAAATYQINAIPATYMVDPDGNILAKDLRGKSLERKLQELFD
jgi:peroxiredoxin